MPKITIRAGALTIALQCLMSSTTFGAITTQVLWNNLAAGKGNNAKGALVKFYLRDLGGEGRNPPPTEVHIKDRNGGGLNLMSADALRRNWTWAGNQAGLDVTADPAAPIANNSKADLFWVGDSVMISLIAGSKWRDADNANLGDMKLIGAGAKLEKLPALLSASGAVTFHNEEAETVVITNIRVYKNQPLQNYTIPDFQDHIGTPLVLQDVTLDGNSDSSSISIGSVDPNTYQLVSADFYKLSEPQLLFGYAQGRNLDEVIPVPTPKETSPAGDMTAAREPGGSVLVTYAPACGASDHVVYAGRTPIAGSLAWSFARCGIGASGTASFDPGAPAPGVAIYFVVVGQNTAAEGSYGRSSAGVERSEAVGIGTCDLPQDLTGVCP